MYNMRPERTVIVPEMRNVRMRKLHDYRQILYNNRNIILIIGLSSAIRLALFGYAAISVPSAKFMPDTPTYLEPGINLIEKGVFATFDDNGQIRYEINR